MTPERRSPIPTLPERAEVLRSTRVVTPDGVLAAAVHVAGGRITAVTGPDEVGPDARVTDLGDLALLPGAVDTHVHVNEPGRTEWEGFATATRAAAAGGVTTIIDMPLNSIPPTTSVAALAAKRAAAAGQVAVDVGFWGGIIGADANRLRDLEELHDAGVFGFKAFLAPSGVEEFPHVSLDALAAAAKQTARLGALTVVHAESPTVLDSAPPAAGRSFANWLRSRPPAAETEAIASLAALSAATGARLHVLHLAAAEALDDVLAARAAGLALTVETCPHYLSFIAEEVPDGATEFKCAPPIREAANLERLWDGLAEGLFVGVVSDHSPASPDVKSVDTGDFGTAWAGSRRSSSARGRSGPGPVSAAGAWLTSSAGWRPARPTTPACGTRAGSPSARMPTSSCSTRKVPLWWTPQRWLTGTRSRPTLDEPWMAWSTRPTCAASGSTATAPRAASY